MSIEDLERMGNTLPRDQWGKREVRSAVNGGLFLAAAAGAVIAAALMYWGDGRAMTWLGSVLFLITLVAATLVVLRATKVHCRISADRRH
jgi:fatty acid desaturase